MALKINSRAFASERQGASRHLIKNDPKRKQIRACVRFLGPDLLRRHVDDGSDRRTRAGQAFLTDRRLGRARRCFSGTGRQRGSPSPAQNPESWRAPLGNEDVCGLDVPMDDACGVSRVKCIRDLNGKRENGLQFPEDDPRSMLQGHAVHKLHGDERAGRRACRSRKSCRYWGG